MRVTFLPFCSRTKKMLVDPYATNAILAYLAILNEGVACILNSSPLIFMICTYTEWPINIQRYMHIFGYVKKVIDKNVNYIIKKLIFN